MKNYIQDYPVCANTILLDRYLYKQEIKNNDFNYVYDKIAYMFKEDLKKVECKEDIEADLIFEIQYLIDRNSFNIEADEVAEQICKDFDIKVAE